MSASVDGSQAQEPTAFAGDPDDGPQFGCAVERRDGIVLLALSGELDIAAVEPFERAAGGCLDGDCRHLVIDLRALEFIDSCGLRALLRVRANAGETVRFELVQGPPSIARVFEITGLTPALPFRDMPPIGHLDGRDGMMGDDTFVPETRAGRE